MNIALRSILTVPEYLVWAEAQTETARTELINGQIVSMSAERMIHIRLKAAIFLALRDAVDGAGFAAEVVMDGATVPIDPHTAYVPDALIHAGPRIGDTQMTVPDPIVVAEVLSPSTAHTDMSAKLIGYLKLPSVMHYLIVDPDALSLVHHWRGAGGAIQASTHTSGILRLDPPGLELSVDRIFGYT